ncbi:hypothetical protein PPERSA_11564 [Pseudocohnilembus persalinus]|uniref:Uncharacterized protein n=1 Tax=Pseudocohnilembus persalinus TaxID=266149 RepID=A0A0V0Q9Q4_PSEPJ|nr:hypothetical protein PPERSA_11564 [Pseudocohnilembus persalinus]|eukprot:KRW98963.1 hypothetical protein PPERSA_11564 [Pseudocohnilembus persalinus]
MNITYQNQKDQNENNQEQQKKSVKFRDFKNNQNVEIKLEKIVKNNLSTIDISQELRIVKELGFIKEDYKKCNFQYVVDQQTNDLIINNVNFFQSLLQKLVFLAMENAQLVLVNVSNVDNFPGITVENDSIGEQIKIKFYCSDFSNPIFWQNEQQIDFIDKTKNVHIQNDIEIQNMQQPNQNPANINNHPTHLDNQQIYQDQQNQQNKPNIQEDNQIQNNLYDNNLVPQQNYIQNQQFIQNLIKLNQPNPLFPPQNKYQQQQQQQSNANIYPSIEFQSQNNIQQNKFLQYQQNNQINQQLPQTLINLPYFQSQMHQSRLKSTHSQFNLQSSKFQLNKSQKQKILENYNQTKQYLNNLEQNQIYQIKNKKNSQETNFGVPMTLSFNNPYSQSPQIYKSQKRNTIFPGLMENQNFQPYKSQFNLQENSKKQLKKQKKKLLKQQEQQQNQYNNRQNFNSNSKNKLNIQNINQNIIPDKYKKQGNLTVKMPKKLLKKSLSQTLQNSQQENSPIIYQNNNNNSQKQFIKVNQTLNF